jgi:hypothetical protein
MIKARRGMAAALIAALGLVGLSGNSFGSAFVAWRVTDVSPGDLLNVRAYPAPISRILVGYPNGTRLSMTGRCTGDVQLDEIQRLPAWKQRQIVRYKWCEAWLDPDGSGNYRNGWVYGRYIRPA